MLHLLHHTTQFRRLLDTRPAGTTVFRVLNNI